MADNAYSETRTRVMVHTAQHRILGEVSLHAGSRLTDFMNNDDRFLPITNAHVTTHDGRELMKADFLNLNRHHIELIIEEASIH